MKRALFFILLPVLNLSVMAQDIHRTACQGNLARLDSMLINTPIDVKDNRGRSLMHWAVACKREEIFNYLVGRGININGEDNQQKTPMHVAVQYSNQYFDLLVNLQPNNDWINLYGVSLLEQAVLNKDIFLTEKLVEMGVDINGANNRGSTALAISQRLGAKDISGFLLSQGADQSLVRTVKMEGKYMG
ncbi:MAG: ankyrin repeat domain-containing protein, partial [Cytophagales bacterium]|nr:ankyrin repeat domain-containing protein [Cytophagales bacterium]